MNNYLREHKFPEDLKNMSFDDLQLLSFEIRDFLVDSVSKTGGHLASNLGAVELTIALLKSFDAPKDKILWDVGHQTYVYKMLTGRIDGFETLRQLDGMSGFPKVKESEYDVFDTGHSSTSISLGMGLAAARDLNKEDYQVVSVIGDGSMTGGIAFEALNNMLTLKSKMIVVLNDNGMSISKNTGGLSSYLSRLRGTRKYINMKANIKKRMNRLPVIGNGMISGVHNAKESIKSAVIVDEGMFFEELGIKYFGPIDGHNIQELCETLEVAKSFDKPVIIHAITEKGKGYSKAEERPNIFHGIGPFDPDTGELIGKSSGPSYSKVFGNKLIDMAAKNDKIVAVSAAMIDGTGLDKYAQEYPDRMFDVGIAEGHAVTFSAGMAKAGLKPYVAVYSTFLQRAYDQLIEDICLQNLPAVFCLDRAGIVGSDGETHHGILDLSYLSSMPNMTIMAPKDGAELERMMELSESMDSPCAIRYPRGTALSINDNPVELGKAEQLTEGNDCIIWAIGAMVDKALKAAELLKADGINVGVFNARFLKPLDEELIKNSIQNAKLVVTVEDNVLSGGLGEAIDSCIINEGVKIVNLSWPDRFIEHGTQAQLYARYGLDEMAIAERIRKELER